MAVSEAQLKSLILAELEAAGADLTALSGQMDVIWELYAAKRYVAGRLQYLYARRHAIRLLMGRRWQDVTVTDAGTTSTDSDLIKNLGTLLEATEREIGEVESIERGGRPGHVGQLTTTSPVTVTSGNDPSSRQYRGDPLLRLWRG